MIPEPLTDLLGDCRTSSTMSLALVKTEQSYAVVRRHTRAPQLATTRSTSLHSEQTVN